MSTKLHVTEHLLGNKAVRQAHSTQKAAFEHARQRVQDPDVGTVNVWCYESNLVPLQALMESIAGREWCDERKLVAVVAKKSVAVRR